MRGSRSLIAVAACAAVLALPDVALATLAAPGRIVDRDGVVYRRTSAGPKFHPLLSFQSLNAELNAGHRVRANRLARVLIARARPRGRALVWEYDFRYAGNPAPWSSGMAQAVGAEALARAGRMRAARRAYIALRQGLLARPNGVTWIRLYSFSTVPVLNAQLQSALSLRRYARLADDPRAALLARRLLAGADALFPRFETACWSRYSLDGREAPASYHRYVGELITRVVAISPGRAWRERAEHFYASQRRPALGVRHTPRTLYPVPVDRFRDRGLFAFSLSKCAWVTLQVGKRTTTAWYPPGRHEIRWRPRRIPGNYPVRLTAVDSYGRRKTLRLPPLVIRRDQVAPRVRAIARGPQLRWLARDAATPWLRLTVELHRPGARLRLPVGRTPLQGTAELPVLPWPARAVLIASDSSGNTTRVALGEVRLLGRLGGPVIP